MDITKAIIPAAGLATKFLPLTKSIPQEMLPLLNKPAIQYIVEEGLQSDIANFSIVTNKEKQAISRHFDTDLELELLLKECNKSEALIGLDRIIRAAHFSYIRQSEPMGTGHAIWMARHGIGKEYFGVLMPDDIIVGKNPALGQLIKIARQEKASVIAIQEVPIECSNLYGMIVVKKQITPNLFQVSQIIEKPAQKDTPSNLAVIGRYVLSYKLFDALADISTFAVGQLQLTDGINQMMKNNEKVYAYKIQGTRFDIGSPIGWIKAVISMSLQHPEYAPAINKFLHDHNTIESFLYNQNKNISHTL